MANTTEIAIANLYTTEKYFDHFSVEMHTDNTGANRVGIMEIKGAWDAANSRFAQQRPQYFQNAVIGTMYYFRSGVVDKFGNPSAWSAWINIAAGSNTAPSVSYAATAATTAAGVRLSANPASPPAVVNHYEFFWNTTNTAPSGTSLPNLPPSTNGTCTIHLAIGETAYIWIRAVDTFGNKQAWTSLGSLLNGTLDHIGDGSNFIRGTLHDFPEAVQNANFELGSGTNVPGWTPQSAVISIDAGQSPPFGTNALKVAATAIFGAAISVMKFPCVPGEVYKISGYVKSDGVTFPDIQLMVLTSTGTYLTGAQYAPSVSTSWQSGSATVTIPATGAIMQISLQTNAAGTVWFKGIKVAKVRVLDDEVLDGSTYARPLSSRINAGRPFIDFSETIHSNKNLDNLGDGSSRFARLATHSSYRPLSNPLTASTTSVSVAAHTMRVGGTDVSLNSGSVSGLTANTLNYTYYDDASLAGGGVTYNANTTKETALAGNGRFFIGSVVAKTGGVGNNDGGVGAQMGSNVTLFTTAFGAIGDGTNTFPATIDGFGTAHDDNVQALAQGGVFSGIQNPQFAANSKILSITSTVTKSGVGTVSALLAYSLDAGSTYTTIYSVNASRAQTTDQVTLAAGQDLTKVRVKVKAAWASGTSTSVDLVMQGIQLSAQG